MVSSSASPDSLRKKLEEIFKLMLVVWAKEGLALKAISGKKTGKSIYEIKLTLTKTHSVSQTNRFYYFHFNHRQFSITYLNLTIINYIIKYNDSKL